MRIAIAYEKRDNGGIRPTWRIAPSIFNSLGRSKELGRSIRLISNRQQKKMRIV